ncbi:MAG: hypothetical protein ACOC44_16675 [Promethearchaeia archaeon]
MQTSKRQNLPFQPPDFMPMREYMEYLLDDPLLSSERKVWKMLRLLDHLKLSYDLLSEKVPLEEPLTADLLKLLFMEHILHIIKRIGYLIIALEPDVGASRSYQKLRELFSECQKTIREQGMQSEIKRLRLEIS